MRTGEWVVAENWRRVSGADNAVRVSPTQGVT